MAFIAAPAPLELMMILVLALLVLGPKRLPEAARSVGRGMRELRDSLQGGSDNDDRYDDDEDDDDVDPELAEGPAGSLAEGEQAPPEDPDAVAARRATADHS
jgi:sec-independent protein translocase protein TatA